MTEEQLAVTVARLDERLEGFKTIMEQMAAEQKSMADSYKQLVESNQRIAVVESELLSIKESNRKLWERVTALDAARSAAEERRLQGELKSRNGWLSDLVKMGLGAAVSAILIKLTGHSL